MRAKLGMENRDEWRCMFCCHVRTGTILLGTWHLILHVLILAIVAVILMHPDFVCVKTGPSGPSQTAFISVDSTNLNFYDYQNEYAVLRERKWNTQDVNVGLAITLCTFMITLLMLYGAIKGKPTYLMPFFILQVFDFCIASLTVIGFFSYMPDVRQTIEENPNIPFQKELLKLNSQLLSFIMLILFVILMMVKAYFIGVVWSCYKYLTYRNTADEIMYGYIDPDTQALLPPDYEAAIKDQKYPAVYPSGSTPPPPYSPPDETV